jgi:capping protein (actin filament) muscle Z-line, beta
MKGTWDSIHVVEVQDSKKNAHYKLTSTVMLSIETETEATGIVNLAGSLTRQVCFKFIRSLRGSKIVT